MALSAGSQRKSESTSAEITTAPQLDNTVIYQGGIVMLDSSGRAKPGATATGCTGVGIASSNKGIDRYDNTVTGHADGFLTVTIKEGIFGFKNDGTNPFLSSTVPGCIAYITDDETVAVTDGSSTKSTAGFFHHLDAVSGLVYVQMGAVLGALAKDMVTVTDAAAAHLAGAETFTGVKNFASGADPIFAKEADHTLLVTTTTTAATAGGALTIKAATSGTSGTGGALALVGGIGGTTGVGGAASLKGGAGGSSSGTGGAVTIAGGAGSAGNATGGAVTIDGGAKNGSGADGLISIGVTSGTFLKLGVKMQATATANLIVAATGTAIPVTASGSLAITQNGAETNTLADPTFLGQTIDLFVDTDTSGARVVTAASRINQAANTVITMTEVGDFISLRAITIAGALKWQVVANDGCALS